jgi:uncharacterized lipoprotein
MRVRRLAGAVAMLLASVALAGCATTACEPADYVGATSVPPMRVPDNLDPPDQTRALRIPDVQGERTARRTSDGRCLEAPPDYFSEGLAPGD